MGLRSWFGDRLPVSGQQFRELTNEPVPYHLKRWWFALGGTPAYLFIVQIFTGILLAFYYEASPTTAYESVEYITREVSFGWYIRSVHKWAATLMIVAVILHQIRVFFTGAYRKPREINWIVGMCLLFATLMTGFTGYSLVYEQLSFWGATVGANIADSLPWWCSVMPSPCTCRGCSAPAYTFNFFRNVCLPRVVFGSIPKTAFSMTRSGWFSRRSATGSQQRSGARGYASAAGSAPPVFPVMRGR